MISGYFCSFGNIIQSAMSLVKSISGIRGTIGGKPGNNLTPPDIIKFTSAYGTWLRKTSGDQPLKVIVGRDARRSGELVNKLVINTLRSLGIDVTDLGLATTPTVELAVKGTGAHGGIIITASHNPAEWNALKLLNGEGEFLSSADGLKVLAIADSENFEFAPLDAIGSVKFDDTWTFRHINLVKGLKLVDTDAIESAGFSIAVDCVNSVGGIVIPALLRSLGVSEVIEINTRPDGYFAHNPEPLPQHLTEISEVVVKEKADLGFVVDPDVDRLAIVCEDGKMFGEEYTLVAVADYVLMNTPGDTVSNLSSTRALKDVSEKYGCKYFTAAVGEVNVVDVMKKVGAVIGGEGNGGVIYPESHYGRDALVGIGLFLTHLAKSRKKCSELRRTYPDYFIAKKRMNLEDGVDFGHVLEKVRSSFAGFEIDERDGMRIEHPNGWVQIRKSNTEPIMRVYAEAANEAEAEKLADNLIDIVKNA